MLNRIFIAVAPPDGAKDEIANVRTPLAGLPARWVPRENLHITFAFLGNMSDAEVEKLGATLQEVVRGVQEFSLMLSRVVYGPDASDPRMIWAVGEAPQEFLRLEEAFAKAWPLWRGEGGSVVHMTLVRLNAFAFRRMEEEERPIVERDIHIEIPVRSLEIMKSELERGGARYTILRSVPLLSSR
ncbi:MAG: RNA 2',3'-cyclic phosphodiesterase [Candidatus Wildermuthbacteria bacterium]|nr:RNA 2',3'-cyclic phosphodiesterase [Candidatus Wildermuthbacteria bacterium]